MYIYISVYDDVTLFLPGETLNSCKYNFESDMFACVFLQGYVWLEIE